MARIMKTLGPVVAASLLLAACGSSSSSSSGNPPAASQSAPASPSANASATTVKTASNSKLGATVLVNAHGLTLYSLSGERNGKWICTSAGCLQAWHPLTVPNGGKPSGQVGSLGTVTRPDGTTQVTYKSMPLYNFAQDHNPGDAAGQGIKDVGTWTAVTVASTTPATTSKPATPTPAPSSGGGYGY